MNIIALDVGGQSVKSGIVDAAHQLADKVHSDPIDSLAEADAILAVLARIVTARFDDVNGDAHGVALAFPGPFDYAKGICLIQHTSHTGGVKFGALYGLDVGAALHERLGRPTLPIVFRNDAEAAIVGEAVHGAGRGYARVIGVTLGTGFGSAFVRDGAPQTAGVGVPENGWLYCMPYAGATADDAFSTRGLLARLRAAGCEAASVAVAAQLAQSSQALQALFASFGADLGQFLQAFADGFDAQAVIVLGGIAQAWDLIAPGLRAALTIPAFHGALDQKAALIGAAALLGPGT